MASKEYTYNLETTTGQIRLLISDVGGSNGSSWIFDDEEIQTFYKLRGSGDVRLAAATALRTLAGNGAMVQGMIKFLEIETNADKFVKSLNELAARYEKEVDDDTPIELAEMGVDVFAQRQLRAQAAEMFELD